MSVREEVKAALKDILLQELTEIKKGLADLTMRLDKVIGRMGRPKDDFEHIEDMQAAGASYEQAVAIVKAKHAISQASKADLDKVGLKVEDDLKATGFTTELSQVIVKLMKDVRREGLEKLAVRV